MPRSAIGKCIELPEPKTNDKHTGDTTAPLFFCVPSVLPAGWKLVYNSLANRAGGSSTGTGAVDPYVQSQCPALSTLEASLAAYVVGPSISQCFVGCRYNISSTGVTQYRTQSQAWSSSSENATANIFNAQVSLVGCFGYLMLC